MDRASVYYTAVSWFIDTGGRVGAGWGWWGGGPILLIFFRRGGRYIVEWFSMRHTRLCTLRGTFFYQMIF